MSLELLLLLGTTILPVFYTANLGVFLYEENKYLSELGNMKLLNFWFPIIGLLFLMSFALFYDNKLEIIFFPICFYFLVFYNIYVLGKLLRGKLEKVTSKKLVYLLICFVGIDTFLIVYFGGMIYLYSYILFVLLLNYIVFLTLRSQQK